MMQCPICDKSFVSSQLFLDHIEDHKNDSFLNKPPELSQTFDKKPSRVVIDVTNFFGKTWFEEMISEKIKKITDIDELVHRRNFVEQAKKIISKNPFVYLPYFIDDLLRGEDSSKMLKKYYVSNLIDLKIIINDVLMFDRNRHHKRLYANAFEMNLKIPNWQNKYDTLQNNFDFFKNDLLELTFQNILRSFILITITDYVDTGISKQDIITNARSLKTHYDIFKFVDDPLKKSFEPYFKLNFENTVYNILDELVANKILKKKTGTPELFVGKLSIDKIKQSVVDELKYNDGSQNEYSIRTTIHEQYPSLRLIPGLGMWDTALDELSDEKIIHLKSGNTAHNSHILFLNEDYHRIQQNLHRFDDANIEFYGRKIAPEDFIDELLELEKGDFADKDDQVTRIAGLLLIESIPLQAPDKDTSDFDFTFDITNYKFRPEQQEAITKLNFQIHSNIFHCKVMLDEKLTIKKYHAIKNSLPRNEQGIVFTFTKIPQKVQEQLVQDKSIQIINKEGLKIWASTTLQIPSRKNSVAKLYFDPISKLEKTMCRVNLIDYENGLASISALPGMHESTVLVRSLEEISIEGHSLQEFELFSSKYFEFLQTLAKLSRPNDFSSGMFDTKIHKVTKKTKHLTSIVFENHEVLLNLNEDFKNMISCNCLKWLENNVQLCPHCVSALDHLSRNLAVSDTWDKNNAKIKDVLENIVKGNVSIILDRLGMECDVSRIIGNPQITSFVLGVSKIKENS